MTMKSRFIKIPLRQGTAGVALALALLSTAAVPHAFRAVRLRKDSRDRDRHDRRRNSSSQHLSN